MFPYWLKYIRFQFEQYKKWKEYEKKKSEHWILTRHHFSPDDVEAGEYTYGIPKIFRYVPDIKVRIGKFCSIATNVQMILGGQHHSEYFTQYGFSDLALKDFPSIKSYSDKEAKDIEIGNDVWIGQNAVIMSGVKIGDGAIIGTNALVTKDVPAYAVYGGVPARFIKMRFDDETIAKLKELDIWNRPIEEIKQIIPDMLTTDIDVLYNKYAKWGG